MKTEHYHVPVKENVDSWIGERPVHNNMANVVCFVHMIMMRQDCQKNF